MDKKTQELTVRQAAKLAGIVPSAVHDAIQKGRLRSRLVIRDDGGKIRYIRRQDFEKWRREVAVWKEGNDVA